MEEEEDEEERWRALAERVEHQVPSARNEKKRIDTEHGGHTEIGGSTVSSFPCLSIAPAFT